jgi:DNA helicase-2/ATP-dependent DNA helicase PcrA
LHQLVAATGIVASLQAEKTPENISRLQNIDELLNGIRTFVDENVSDAGIVGLDQYLANVSLLTNADNDKPEDNDKVTVMTVHSSKGLEFDVVYIVGMEENLFPSQMSISSMQNIEEERRLFYVALTRARKCVYLSYAGVRFRWGSMSTSAPSRFIKEIDQRFLEASPPAPQRGGEPLRRPLFANQERSAPYECSTLSPLGRDGEGIAIKPGMTVEHLRFGVGKVLALDGNGSDAKATIHFGNEGQKTLVLKFAKLKIVK